MTDKVQKIREEVGRIQLYTQSEVLKQVLDYIDEVQEEPRFKVGQTIADPTDPTFTFHINKIDNGKYIESDDAWVLIKDADEEYQLVEEPVSDSLADAAGKYGANVTHPQYYTKNGAPVGIGGELADAVIYGAKWQKEKTIRKACKWIEEINNHHHIIRYSDSCEVTSKELIEWFKNYMEE